MAAVAILPHASDSYHHDVLPLIAWKIQDKHTYNPVVPAYAQSADTGRQPAATMAAPAGEDHDSMKPVDGQPARHAAPLQQQRDGVLLSHIQCNPPRDLYIRDSQRPLCLYPGTYEALLALGIDLTAPELADVEVVTIGLLAPVTGGAARYGEDISAATFLAVDDFNGLLQERGEPWRLNVESRDSKTHPDVMAEEVVSFNERRIKIVAGPSIDLYSQDIIDYADSNGMLLVSCCSILPEYAVAGDSLFRMTPDSTHQGHALAGVMHDEGIKVVIPAGRDALWITVIVDSAEAKFLELGEGVFEERILYDISGEFAESDIQRLVGNVAKRLDTHDPDQVAVLYIGFEETYDFIEMAAGSSILGEVRWFGSETNTILHDSATALVFADGVNFTAIQPTARESEIGMQIAPQLTQALGRTPSVYALHGYDAVQLIGRAILETGGTSAADIREALPRIAEGYTGAGGTVTFNAAGDRDGGPYAVWEIKDGIWIQVAEYDTSAVPLATLTAEEAAWLEENPTMRVAYHPTWFPFEYVDESGRLAGVAPQYMSEFGRITGADFVQVPISDWTDALDSVRDRDADVIFMVASTADRLEYMSFTTPHYTIGTSLATLGDQPADINDEGLRLLTIRNHAIEAWLDENHPDVEYVSVDGYAAGLEMMQAGDADALAATWQPVYSYAEIAGIEGLYNAGPTGHEYDITIGYRNDQPILGSILQKALDEIPLSALAQMFQSQISE